MYIVLLIILLTAAAVDTATGKISNRIIVYGILSGILCRFARDGAAGLLISLSGIFIPSAFLIFLYGCKMIGAGDVKFMSVTGSFLGASDSINCLLPILLFAGILSLICYLAILIREKEKTFLQFHVIPMAVPMFLGIFWYLCKISAM